MQQFTPLPLRARSVLELIDTSLKVYKQYFLVLIVWSAGIRLLGIVPILSPALAWLSYMVLLLTPFKLSVSACCVAGAVRGQTVSFGQSWEFSKPRYGSMLGWLVSAWIVGFLGFLLLLVPGLLLVALIAGVSGAAGAVGGGAGSMFAMVLTFIVFFVAISVGLLFMYAWTYFVPLIACMEEARAGQGPMKRSYELLRGQWWRLMGLSTVLGAGAIMLMLAAAAACGLGADIDGLRRSITGGQMSPEFLRAIMGASIGISLVMMLFEPVMMLAMVLFYLDVRVRKEALDLEWAAHQSQPPDETPSSAAYENMAPSPVAPSDAFGAPTEPALSSTFGDFASFATPVASNPSPPPVALEPPFVPFTPVPVVATDAAVATDIAAPDSMQPAAVPWQELVEETPAAPPVASPTDVPLPGNVPTVICPQCQSVSPATSIFCMACGTRLKDDSAV